MLMLTASALAIGLALSLLLPFLAFAAGLVTAVLIGVGVALAQGRTVGDTALTALGVLVACQLGYGVGLLLAALVRSVRPARASGHADEAGKPLERLRHEQE